MTNPTFSGLPAQTQSELAQLSTAVEGVLPIDVQSWRFDVSTLPLESHGFTLIEEVAAWAGKSKACLYYFECHSPNIDLVEIERTFADAKAHEANDRAYPRLNAKSKYFYVGSSQSVAKRLREHLGFGASKTYALQLSHWARSLSLELEFVCAKYPENTPPRVVESLEDTLWKTRNPMFGRQGRK
jgi:hypothetical protein